MKRYLLVLAVVLAILLSIASCLIVVEDRDGHIEIFNDTTTYEIRIVYIRESGTINWGSDWLGSDIIEPGETVTFDVDPGTYDVQVIDDWSDSYQESDVYVSAGITVTLIYDGFSLY